MNNEQTVWYILKTIKKCQEREEGINLLRVCFYYEASR